MCNWVEMGKAAGSIYHLSLKRWSNKIIHHVLNDDLVIYEKIRMMEDKEDEKKEEKKEKRECEGQEKRGEESRGEKRGRERREKNKERRGEENERRGNMVLVPPHLLVPLL